MLLAGGMDVGPLGGYRAAEAWVCIQATLLDSGRETCDRHYLVPFISVAQPLANAASDSTTQTIRTIFSLAFFGGRL